MTIPATSPIITAAERQTTDQAEEILRILPMIRRLEDRVAELWTDRRIDETSTPLWEAARHLSRAWSLLLQAQLLCEGADFSDED